jgi:hypothetical protein
VDGITAFSPQVKVPGDIGREQSRQIAHLMARYQNKEKKGWGSHNGLQAQIPIV